MDAAIRPGDTVRIFSLTSCVMNKSSDIMFFILVSASIVPVWLFPFIPTQDGPIHLANANIIRSLLFDENSYFANYYHFTQWSFTNWAIYLVINCISFFVDILTAEKVVVSAYLVLLSLSMRYAVLSIGERNSHLQFLILPVLYNVTLSYGFYNFILSLPMFFLSIGYWYKHKSSFCLAQVILLSLMLLVSYLTHPLVFVFIAVTLSVAAFYSVIIRVCKTVISIDEVLSQSKVCFVPVVLAIIPCVFLFLLFLSSEGATSAYTNGFYARFYALTRLTALVSYGAGEAIVSKLYSIALIAIFMAATIRQAKAALSNPFALPLIVSIVLYFAFPDEISNGSVINHRLQLFVVFTSLLYFARQSFNRITRVITISFCTALFIVSLSFTVVNYSSLNAIICEAVDMADHVQSGSNILSLSFEKLTPKLAVNPLLHIAAHISWKRNVVDLSNFQATQTYFPVNYSFESVYSSKQYDVERVPPRFDIVKYSAEFKNKIDYIMIFGDYTKNLGDSDVLTMSSHLKSFYSLTAHNGYPLSVRLFALMDVQ